MQRQPWGAERGLGMRGSGSLNLEIVSSTAVFGLKSLVFSFELFVDEVRFSG
jgi:hypothetical protein